MEVVGCHQVAENSFQGTHGYSDCLGKLVVADASILGDLLGDLEMVGILNAGAPVVLTTRQDHLLGWRCSKGEQRVAGLTKLGPGFSDLRTRRGERVDTLGTSTWEEGEGIRAERWRWNRIVCEVLLQYASIVFNQVGQISERGGECCHFVWGADGRFASQQQMPQPFCNEFDQVHIASIRELSASMFGDHMYWFGKEASSGVLRCIDRRG